MQPLTVQLEAAMTPKGVAMTETTRTAENGAPLDEWEWCTDDCPEDCEADHKGEE